MEGVTYWITGLSGAGKTTIGNRLFYELKRKADNVVLLDGDILKGLFKGDYSLTDRKKRAYQYASLCKVLSDQGICVICCTISMFEDVRTWNRIHNKRYVEIFLDTDMEVLKKRDQKGLYSQKGISDKTELVGIDLKAETPAHPDLVIKNNGELSVKQCVDLIMSVPLVSNTEYDRDTQYWNAYYEAHRASSENSDFAAFAVKNMPSVGTILDLGCGNGRDSLFFRKNGFQVTGIDASSSAINRLQAECADDGNIYFICDDFVCSSTVYSGQYDYCYSRFSLHAINELQEKELFENVYKVLKDHGKFFIETRGIHDELYGKGKKIKEDTFFHDGHFRRFLRKEVLLEKLKKCGFQIEYEAEKRGFAILGEEDPMVIRVIALKPQENFA